MKRTKPANKVKQVDAILTADWHIREDQPVCRVDDFQSAQWTKIKFISDLQKKYGCPILHAGDLFHHWKPSPYLLSKCYQNFPNEFFTVYGNHDLPQNSIELKEKCGIYTLQAGNRINVLSFGYWNDTPKDEYFKIKDRKIFVWHKFVFTQKEFWQDGDHAQKILRQYSQFDLFVTGDNHKPFVSKYENRLLVNPGNITRQEASQIDFKPRVYLYDASQNIVESIYLPINEDAVSREHLVKQDRRDKRIEAFVQSFDSDWESDIDFLSNLKLFEQNNETDKDIMQIIYKSLD
ncbi:MAG: metallophosphoesterase family protein [Bacteroidales bacterium]